MKRWQEAFEQHPIHNTLNNIEEATTADHPIDDVNLAIEQTRLLKVIRLIRSSVQEMDPDLTPTLALDSINNQLINSGALKSAQNFATTGNAQSLINANNQIDPAIRDLYLINTKASPNYDFDIDIGAATASFEKFAEKTQKILDTVIKNSEESRSSIESASQEISALKKTAEASAETFSAELEEWKRDKTEALNEQSKEFTDLLNQSTTNASQTIQGIADKAKRDLNQFFNEQRSHADDEQDKIKKYLKGIEQSSTEAHKRILSLYNIVARDSVIGGYKSIADREYNSARDWRRLSVTSIALTIIWLICNLIWGAPSVEPSKLFWLQIGKSAVITTLLISFAIYASKQANLHRANEQKTRSFSLQVQAFDPFIASLPETERNELKKALSERIFGDSKNGDDDKLLRDSSFQGLEQLAALIERIRKSVGK